MSKHMTGLEVVIRNFNKAIAKIPQRTARGMYMAGTEIMKLSKEITPVDTGTLKRSGEVKRPVETLFGPVVELGYYGVDYAVYVHEIPARHQGMGVDHFLEKAIKIKQPEAIKIIREEAKF